MPIFFICECFSGGGGVVYNGIFRWGGHKSRQTDRVSHKTWLQKVHGGLDMGGGDLEIKNIQNKIIFFVLFHVKDIEDTVYGM